MSYQVEQEETRIASQAFQEAKIPTLVSQQGLPCYLTEITAEWRKVRYLNSHGSPILNRMYYLFQKAHLSQLVVLQLQANFLFIFQ